MARTLGDDRGDDGGAVAAFVRARVVGCCCCCCCLRCCVCCCCRQPDVFLPRRVDSLLATVKMYDAQTNCCDFLSLVPPIVEKRQKELTVSL